MRSVVLSFGACLFACGGEEPTAMRPSVFIAVASSFEGYPAFTHFSLSAGDEAGSVHTAGPRELYINALPPAGSTSFPVGTIIVKTVSATDQTFAMVKRGGGYNAVGATGWEWFELKSLPSGLAILWRGITPPSGEHYSGTQGGACNDCHAAARDNDFVRSTALNLGALK
ncbi:MAG: hypothetical protein U1E65_01650 [Myxococcota bacterium]